MKVLIIGAGKMGEAVLKRWLQNNLESKKAIGVVEINKKKRNALKKKYADVEFNKEIPDSWTGYLLLLAIKPQNFLDVAKEINSKNITTKIVLSIMAGVTLRSLEKRILCKAIFFRAMPNLASNIGMGVTGVFSRKTTIPKYKKKVEQLLNSLGWVYWIKM